MHCLEGKTITTVDIAKDRMAIRFSVQEGDPIIARADADCCSHTWIEYIEQPAMGFPCLVLSVEDLDLPGSDDNHPEHECLQVYGLKISTDRGDIVVDYRNSSNGYYGGNLVFPSGEDGARFYGGVYGQNLSKEVWESLSPE